jgi:hypothetical protein
MKVYRSGIYEALHEDFKMFLEDGKITPERMAEFEKDAFKEVPDVPASRIRVVRTPAIASPGYHGRGVK